MKKYNKPQVDDRTSEERGLKPLKDNKFVIKKSRYDTTDCYLYDCSAPYNDVTLQYDAQHYERLLEGGVDELLARHVAHLFIRLAIGNFQENFLKVSVLCRTTLNPKSISIKIFFPHFEIGLSENLNSVDLFKLAYFVSLFMICFMFYL